MPRYRTVNSLCRRLGLNKLAGSGLCGAGVCGRGAARGSGQPRGLGAGQLPGRRSRPSLHLSPPLTRETCRCEGQVWGVPGSVRQKFAARSNAAKVWACKDWFCPPVLPAWCLAAASPGRGGRLPRLPRHPLRTVDFRVSCKFGSMC